ncbi:MAG: metallophosphoesterase, partial [Slackia sp.]
MRDESAGFVRDRAGSASGQECAANIPSGFSGNRAAIAKGEERHMAGRVFITGDTHGPSEIRRLNTTFAIGDALDENDYLIVCGDFGLVWADRSKYAYWLRWLEKKPFTTLFIDGNHENFDMLDSMEE